MNNNYLIVKGSNGRGSGEDNGVSDMMEIVDVVVTETEEGGDLFGKRGWIRR